jgi:hypothetical protein
VETRSRWCQCDDRMQRSGRRRTNGWVVYRLPRRGVRGTAGTALLDTLTPRPQSGLTNAAHLDGGLFDRPPPEGFPVVLGQPPPFP